jgi:hypothetical protein
MARTMLIILNFSEVVGHLKVFLFMTIAAFVNTVVVFLMNSRQNELNTFFQIFRSDVSVAEAGQNVGINLRNAKFDQVAIKKKVFFSSTTDRDKISKDEFISGKV